MNCRTLCDSLERNNEFECTPQGLVQVSALTNKRRALEVELESMNSLNGLPEWPLRLVYKFFRNYDVPYPLYAASMSRLASSFVAMRSVIGDDETSSPEPSERGDFAPTALRW
jgi:hypothetical protein